MNWYGKNADIETAYKETQELREFLNNAKSQYFNVKKGQVLFCRTCLSFLKQGQVIQVLKDMPNHSIFPHPENNNKYVSYTASSKYFRPATDEEIRFYYGIEPKINGSNSEQSNGEEKSKEKPRKQTKKEKGSFKSTKKSRVSKSKRIDNSSTSRESKFEDGTKSEDHS